MSFEKKVGNVPASFREAIVSPEVANLHHDLGKAIADVSKAYRYFRVGIPFTDEEGSTIYAIERNGVITYNRFLRDTPDYEPDDLESIAKDTFGLLKNEYIEIPRPEWLDQSDNDLRRELDGLASTLPVHDSNSITSGWAVNSQRINPEVTYSTAAGDITFLHVFDSRAWSECMTIDEVQRNKDGYKSRTITRREDGIFVITNAFSVDFNALNQPQQVDSKDNLDRLRYIGNPISIEDIARYHALIIAGKPETEPGYV